MIEAAEQTRDKLISHLRPAYRMRLSLRCVRE